MTVLETGPWCSQCGIHRALTPAGKCPSCLDEARRDSKEKNP